VSIDQYQQPCILREEGLQWVMFYIGYLRWHIFILAWVLAPLFLLILLLFYSYYPLIIHNFSAILNFALRERGLAAISCSVGNIGFLQTDAKGALALP
jgi:hypothetical protein